MSKHNVKNFQNAIQNYVIYNKRGVEDVINSQGKRLCKEAKTQTTHDVINEDFKSAIISILHDINVNILEINEK